MAVSGPSKQNTASAGRAASAAFSVVLLIRDEGPVRFIRFSRLECVPFSAAWPLWGVCPFSVLGAFSATCPFSSAEVSGTGAGLASLILGASVGVAFAEGRGRVSISAQGSRNHCKSPILGHAAGSCSICVLHLRYRQFRKTVRAHFQIAARYIAPTPHRAVAAFAVAPIRSACAGSLRMRSSAQTIEPGLS